MNGPSPQPKQREYPIDITAYIPAHISQLSIENMRGSSAKMGALSQSDFAPLAERLTIEAKTYRELLSAHSSGPNRTGLPIFWDTVKDDSGRLYVFRVSLLPLSDFKYEISVRRFQNVIVIRNQSSITHSDLNDDILLRMNAKTTDEAVIKDASEILAAEQQTITDRDNIPFRVELTADSIVEMLIIMVGDTDRFYYSFTRPQLHESLSFSPRYGKTSLIWPAHAVKKPDLDALARDDSDIIGDEMPIPDSPISKIEVGVSNHECHTISRAIFPSDLRLVLNLVDSMQQWNVKRVATLGP